MILRAAIYARYSSDQQNPTSIEDQVARCRSNATALGYEVSRTYADFELSGRSVGRRAEYQRMLADARQRRFDAVFA